MADMTYSALDVMRPASMVWRESRTVLTSGQSTQGVNEQIAEVPYSHRWGVSITLRRRALYSERATVEALLAQYADPANRVLIANFAHPNHYGTLSGSPTLSGALSQGATSATIGATTGQTLLAGSLVGITTTAAYAVQVVRVIATATAASSSLTFTFLPALRAAANSGAAVVLASPRARFRMRAFELESAFDPMEAQPIALEFTEAPA